MTNKNVLEIYYSLFDESDQELKIDVKGTVIKHYLSKNKDIIASAAKHLKRDTIIPMGKEYQEYEKKARELFVKHSDGGKKRKVVNVGGVEKEQYDVSESIDKFNKDLIALDKEYKTAIQERMKQMEEFVEFLKKEHEPLKLYTFTLDELSKHNPDVSDQTYEAVKFFISDGNEENQEKAD